MLKSVEIIGSQSITTQTQCEISISSTLKKSVKVVSIELNAPNGAYRMNATESGVDLPKTLEESCVKEE